VPIPAVVASIARGRTPVPVWLNELGGITFEIADENRHRFVKWSPAGSDIDLDMEARRLRWAGAYTRVPEVLESGADAEGSWLVTAAVEGTNAVAPRWKQDPGAAVAAIGIGLRQLHDALPADVCPFSWSVEDRLAAARRRDERREQDPSQWHPDHRHFTVADVARIIREPPPVDELVVCHGDACAPNTLISDDGRPSGHVDLGALGLADRWADLAIATWSATWNYGPGWEPTLLDAYGVDCDAERTRYYRLLWDLT
jgi:kanamycin kinase